MRLPLVVGFAFIAFSGVESAYAACKQSDAQGQWQVYATRALGQVTVCNISVNATGVISNTNCSIVQNNSSQIVKLTKGSIKLKNAATCNFTGGFTISGSLKNVIKSLTLTLNKESAVGFGGNSSTGQFFLNLTRL